MVRLKRGRNFRRRPLQRVLEASPDRVEPRCAHFGVCGGCVLQHLLRRTQLEFKQRQLIEALTRIGKVTPRRCSRRLQGGVWNYRRRARLAARWVPKKERTVLGFRERSTSFIADVKRCEVLRAPVDALVEPLSLLLTALSCPQSRAADRSRVADNAVALVVRILED
jgi:23S rRNA (uracil1939-C5)-methyltransferase